MNKKDSVPIVVSIIIKTLNEEKKVATAIESAIEVVGEVGGEVILADSASTDRTIEIAQEYPIKIVQLAKPSEKCCGIGPQLGYQVAQGEFVYILDGDMKMLPGFLPKAISVMRQDPEIGGVGGQVIEMNLDSLEFQARIERASSHMQSGSVDRLDMGGLYRRAAVEQAGYFSNRNLHSYEELDLAIRLRSHNWKLKRIDFDAVKHWGHDTPPYQLLMKRWNSGYINGLGEILRASWGKPQWPLLIRDVKELKLYVIVLGWWITLLSIWFFPLNLSGKLGFFTTTLLIPLAIMTVRKKSFKKAIYSVVSWNFNTAGLIRGFFSKTSQPSSMIEYHQLQKNNIRPQGQTVEKDTTHH